VLTGLKGRVRSRKLLVPGTVALALLLSVVGLRFHRYAYAVAWHCIHGNLTTIGEHRIGLPILWWEERGSGWTDESLVERGVFSLVRANPASSFDQPRIIARPASPWEVDATDQEVRKSIEAAIAVLNHGSEDGWSHSLVTLSSRQFTMYCMRDVLRGFGSDRLVSLNCSEAKMRYSFAYSGPERHEKEAEIILSTFE